jgi:raffinose/stachyose/melibiose transport system permease protein
MKLHNRWDPYLFLALPFVVYVFVVSIPIIFSVYYSLMDWNGITNIRFIGFGNYVKMFTDRNLLRCLTNNLIYTSINTIYQVGFGLIMAILMYRIVHGRNLLRALLFSPVIISTMAISQTFKKILAINPDGVVNAILANIGLVQLKTAFLANMKLTLIVVALVEAYKYSGLYLVIFYSAFNAIDGHIVEAATIDGVNGWQMYWHIKLPIISPVIMSSIVLVINGTLKSFDIPFILTNGGPGYASELMASYMYKAAFNSMDYGYGSALSIVIIIECAIIVGLITNLTKIQKREV